MTAPLKPLGGKAYGSIGQAPASKDVVASDNESPQATAASGCLCIESLDARPEMVESNTQVLTTWIGPQRAFVSTIKRDEKKRGKPKMVIASFCPFCGVKYSEYVSPFRAVEKVGAS